MAKYICPVCGKVWYNISDLADCVSKDAKAEKEAIAEKARIAALKQSKVDAIAEAKRELDVAFANTKRKIDIYNQLANDFNRTYEDKVLTYSVTLLGEAATDKASGYYKPTSSANPFVKPQTNDLRDLVRKNFGF